MSDIFRGRIPYALGVNALKQEITKDELTEGTVIPHARLSAIIQAERGTERYYGVINSWIKHMKANFDVFMTVERSEGVKIQTPAGRTDYAISQTRQKMQLTRKAVKHFTWAERVADRLEEPKRKQLEHAKRVASALTDALGKAKKDFVFELPPVQSLPKRQIEKPKGEENK